MGVRIKRHGTWVYRDPRWPALRLMARRRDGWRCVQCGTPGRIEVDHILSVRTHPERAFDLTNLQCLCGSCHARKTRVECGHPEASPQRQEWRKLVRATFGGPGTRQDDPC